MTYATNITAATPGEIVLMSIELSHSTWPGPLRYVLDTIDWDLTIEDDVVAPFTAMGFTAAAANADDTGLESRPMGLPDPDLISQRRIEALIGVVDAFTGEPEPIALIVREYLSTDTTTMISRAVLQLANPVQQNDRSIRFDARGPDLGNTSAPTDKFTSVNSPQLRR